jgi:hypothetical protein
LTIIAFQHALFKHSIPDNTTTDCDRDKPKHCTLAFDHPLSSSSPRHPSTAEGRDE